MKSSPAFAIIMDPADAVPPGNPGTPWHALDVADIEQMLATGAAGLSSADARKRLKEYGHNIIRTKRPESAWRMLRRQLHDPLIYVLLAAAGVTIFLRDWPDTAVILVVVVINSAIGFVQESRAHKAVRALSRLTVPRAQAVRDGKPQAVASRTLVPGDIVLLTSGSRIPADLRLMRARNLAIDESLLTGESVPVDKTTSRLVDSALARADHANIAFAGSTVIHGRGRGIVVRTGTATELGRIASEVGEIRQTDTPLQAALSRLSRRAAITIIALGILAFAVGVMRAMPPSEMFLVAVALAVSAIPEGLPVVLTVTLAVGVRRMAQRRAIVRSLPAAETLGSTTVIVSDKTGTLTENQMTVRAVWTTDARYDFTGTGYSQEGRIESAGTAVDARGIPSLLEALRSGVLASETEPGILDIASTAAPAGGDPAEIALLVAAAKGGISPAELHERHPEVDLVPFESERRFMVSLRESGDEYIEHIKGAPEVVLSRCDRQLGASGERPIDRAAALEAARQLAAEGLRVLAVAFRPVMVPQISHDPAPGNYVLAGIIGMDDPIRPEIITAVRDAHAAGIRVLMLTGDHAGTARVVGKKIGLGEEVLEGRDLDRMPDEELDRALTHVRIYARVTPEHKLRVVQHLMKRDEVVAVTGDGVNDGPALRAAHLGIAMGERGSDVAREAADMVLTDDNFATIVGAIEEGRTVFANIRKATFFLMSTAAGEIIAVLAALFSGWPVPFVAAQILWINVVTDSLQVVALAFDPAEPDSRRSPPRRVGEDVLDAQLFMRLIGVGIVLSAITLVTFWWALRATNDLTAARTVAVTQMVVLQFFHVFNCRSLNRSIIHTPLTSNPFLIASVVAVSIAHLLALNVSWLRRILSFESLTLSQWYVVLSAGLLVIAWGELDKWFSRLRSPGRSAG